MLVRNTAFNLVGLGAPLALAIFTIPPLIRTLGPDRFGVLTLIWAVVSYFGLFDLGLGRALTQMLSRVLTTGDRHEARPLVFTALLLMGALGSAAGAVFYASAPVLVSQMRSVPDMDEVVRAAQYLSFAMPFIVATAGFRGVLESVGAFGLLNLIRLPMGVVTFAGPLLAVLVTGPRLDVVAAVLSAGRVLACLAHAIYAIREGRTWPGQYRFSRKLLQPLCVSGGWLTLSNVVSPLMGYLDRFLIGLLISVTAVAYYATPNEIVTKIWIAPAALTAVLLPAFSAMAVVNPSEVRRLFKASVVAMFAVVMPISVILIAYAVEILNIWIDSDFSVRSSAVLQIMAVGILVNCMAHIPSTYLQAVGSFRLVALIHCLEFPFFAFLLYACIHRFGIEGAAWAWTARMVVDAGVMFFYAIRHLTPAQLPYPTMPAMVLAAVTAVMLGGAFLTRDMRWITVLASAMLAGWLLISAVRDGLGTLAKERTHAS